ncbi:MAG: uracil-DNA glycosylase family protein [Hyphomicrobiaceae bacterium]|nr:uracil-DNA glycosylase family protein [Hyphomicrobiaceae bacterium]
MTEIRRCTVCRDAPLGRALPHEPRPVLQISSSARILVSGQAPGTRVHASGKPFTDPSGDRLRDWMGIRPEIFYDARRIAIVPMGFCFPGLDAKGGDLPPRRECAPLWRQRVLDALPAIELHLLVGQYAQRWHLADEKSASMTEIVAASLRRLEAGRQNVAAGAPGKSATVIALPHPSWRNNAWLKKNDWFVERLVPLLRVEVDRLTRADRGVTAD